MAKVKTKPKEELTPVSMMLPKALHLRVKLEADRQGMKLRRWVQAACEEKLAR